MRHCESGKRRLELLRHFVIGLVAHLADCAGNRRQRGLQHVHLSKGVVALVHRAGARRCGRIVRTRFNLVRSFIPARFCLTRNRRVLGDYVAIFFYYCCMLNVPICIVLNEYREQKFCELSPFERHKQTLLAAAKDNGDANEQVSDVVAPQESAVDKGDDTEANEAAPADATSAADAKPKKVPSKRSTSKRSSSARRKAKKPKDVAGVKVLSDRAPKTTATVQEERVHWVDKDDVEIEEVSQEESSGEE